jgi:hypothetical protein
MGLACKSGTFWHCRREKHLMVISSDGTFREAHENKLTTTVAVAMLAVVQPTRGVFGLSYKLV